MAKEKYVWKEEMSLWAISEKNKLLSRFLMPKDTFTLEIEVI